MAMLCSSSQLQHIYLCICISDLYMYIYEAETRSCIFPPVLIVIEHAMINQASECELCAFSEPLWVSFSVSVSVSVSRFRRWAGGSWDDRHCVAGSDWAVWRDNADSRDHRVLEILCVRGAASVLELGKSPLKLSQLQC